MKKLIFALVCIFLFSCKAQRVTLSPFVTVYKSDRVGNVLSEYIILRKHPEIFEIFSPAIYAGAIGKWSVRNDTLFLVSEIEYYMERSGFGISEVKQMEPNILSTPQQYLMMNNLLIDITDYRPILPPYLKGSNAKTVYRRVTN